MNVNGSPFHFFLCRVRTIIKQIHVCTLKSKTWEPCDDGGRGWRILLTLAQFRHSMQSCHVHHVITPKCAARSWLTIISGTTRGNAHHHIYNWSSVVIFSGCDWLYECCEADSLCNSSAEQNTLVSVCSLTLCNFSACNSICEVAEENRVK